MIAVPFVRVAMERFYVRLAMLVMTMAELGAGSTACSTRFIGYSPR